MFNRKLKKRLELLEERIALIEELDNHAWESLSQLKADVCRLKGEPTPFENALNSLEESIDDGEV